MTSVNVLIVEDNPDDAELVILELEASGFELDWKRVETEADYRQHLSPELDIIISDYNLPSFNGLRAFQILKEQQLDIPFIMTSGTIGEEKAVEAMKQGVTDYLLKDRLMRLPAAVEQAVAQRKLRQNTQQIKQALHRSEERLKAIMSALPDIVFLIDETGHYLEVLTGQPDLLTLTIEEYTNKHLSDDLPPEQEKIIYKAISEALASGQTQIVQYHLDFSIGRRWFESRIAPTDMVIDDKATVVLIARDITEQKQVQTQLTSLVNATSYLFKGSSLQEVGEQIVKAVVDELGQADCGLLLVDASEQKMIRAARTGHYSVDVDDVLYLDGLGVVPSAVQTGELTYVPDTSQDERYLASNPDTRSELVVPLKIESKIIGVLDLQSPKLDAFSLEDQQLVKVFAERASSAINTHQLIEEINQNAAQLEWRVAQRTADLQRTTERIEGILNSAQDVIILSNAEGFIEQINPAFVRQFQYQASDVFDKSIDMFIDRGDQADFQKALQQLINDKTVQRLDIKAKTADHDIFFADVLLSPILNQAQQLDGIVCSLRDVSQRKRLEIELRQALQKEKDLNELKSRFVSMVSHEYRTPLSTILLSAELLRDYHDRMTQEKRNKHLNKISNHVHHMTRLMEDMLAVSKAEAVGLKFNPIEMNIKTYLAELVQDLSLNNGDHLLDFATTGACGVVKADAELINTIVSNLISNAIKYSPDNSDIMVNLMCDDEQFTISVIDQGIGIPKEDQDQLFESFHRATNVGTIQGTGLGLAIVKQCAEAHGGTLELESEVNMGTTVTVRFPIEV